MVTQTTALNLARKWRSKSFNDLIGQELVVRILKNSLYKGQLFPVYLFAGQRGCGKTSTARIFAAAVNCQQLAEFRKVFKEGKAVLSQDKKIKVYYFLIKNTDATEIKIAVTINKKNGNAVWRNRLRRLVKESYRLNKKDLFLTCLDKKYSLYMIINPFGFNKSGYRKLKLNDIKFLVEDVLKKVIVEL